MCVYVSDDLLFLLEVGVGAHGLVDAAEALGGRSLDAVGEGELDLGVLFL